MATAVITFTYNENVNLPIWIRYYGLNFGEENLYVADHGSTDESMRDLGKVNKITLPRHKFDEFEKTDFMSYFHRALLSFYDVVIITDCDELLVPDPRKFESLAAYVAKMTDEYVSCIGLNVVHIINKDDPIDLTKGILTQRRYARFGSSGCKILLSRVPINWLPGLHSCSKPPRFDGNLFLFHTKWIDYNLAMARQRVNRETVWSEKSRTQKLGLHHQFEAERFVRIGFLDPLNLVNTNQLHPFNFSEEIATITNETKEKEGFFYIPMNLSKMCEIPDYFQRCF